MSAVVHEHHPWFSPSAWGRWGTCTASPSAIEAYHVGYPASPGTPYTAQGVLAHSVLEAAIKHGLIIAFATYPIGHTEEVQGFEVTVDQEMHNAIEACVEYIDNHGPFQLLMEEQRVGRSNPTIEKLGQPPHTGTADTIAVTKAAPDILHVMDLKYGKGLRVSPIENCQLKIYGVMAMHTFDLLLDEVDTVYLHILQPRLDKFESWSITRKDIEAWGRDALDVAIHEAVHNPQFRPSKEACRFCPMTGHCPAQRDEILNMFEDLDETADAKLPEMDDEQLSRFLAKMQFMSDTIDAVRAATIQRILGGTALDGWKVVEGRSNYKWVDDRETVAKTLTALGVEPFKNTEPPLLTPAQARRAVKSEAELDLLPRSERPEGKPTLVPADDPRPAIVDPLA